MNNVAISLDKRIGEQDFLDRLAKNGINVKNNKAFWRSQLVLWYMGNRGIDMHDNTLSTLSEMEAERA